MGKQANIPRDPEAGADKKAEEKTANPLQRFWSYLFSGLRSLRSGARF